MTAKRAAENSARVPKGRLKIRAVQISGIVDSVALILLDKLVVEPGRGKPGWVVSEGSFRFVLSNVFAINLRMWSDAWLG